MISFIVPAHNEARLIGSTLQAIHRASSTLGEEYEIVVVDDASTDNTAILAAQAGAAAVIPVAHRQIAATRHAGACAARGRILIFVDADTLVDAAVVRAAIEAIRNGAAGGAALGIFDGELPLYARALATLWIGLARFGTLTTGCFLFCTRTAYEAAGGFDRTLYVFEDVALGRALRRAGSVVILRHTVSTSGRNLRSNSLGHALRMLVALVRNGRRFFRSRDALSYWYARRR